jgi:hypothetical protein
VPISGESERVPVAIAEPKLKELQEQKELLETELMQLPEEAPVAVHPAALRHYEKSIHLVMACPQNGITEENEDAASVLRDLVKRVVITPEKKGLLRKA